MSRYHLLLLLLATLLGSYSLQAAEPERFAFMAWDSADDVATFRAMAECSITSVAFVPPKALDTCKELGIGAVVFPEIAKAVAAIKQQVCCSNWNGDFLSQQDSGRPFWY